MTLVIATGGIDLSVGSLMAIAGALAPLIFLGKLVPLPHPCVGVALAFVVPVLVAGAFGWFNGWLVTRFRIQPIIATLVLFIAGRGIAQVLTNGNLQVFNLPSFQFIGLGRVFGIPFQAILMVVIVARRGLDAAPDRVRPADPRDRRQRDGGAALPASRSRRVKRRVYVISGLLSGIAGLIVVARNSASDANLVGLGMELDAIAAVAVGGTLLTGGRATVVGTLVGALIIQLVRYTLLANGVPDAAALVVKAADHRAGRLAAAAEPALRSPIATPPRSSCLQRHRPLRRACSRLSLLIVFGWLRYDNFLGAFNVLSVLRYNSHVRAGRARHVLRHHDRRHRPVGRLDRGARQRRRRPALALWRRARLARRPGGGARGRRLSTAFIITRLSILPFIATLATMLAASGMRAAAGRTTSRSRCPMKPASPNSARAISSAFPIPAWIALLAYRRSARSCSTSPPSAAPCWPSAATRTRPG